MQKSTRVVFVSHGNTTNGGELCLAETVKAIIDHGGFDVFVFIPGPKGSYLENIIAQSGAKVRHLFDNPRWVDYKLSFREKWRRIKSTIGTFIKFARILKNLKPAFVISNTIVSSPAFAFAAKLNGCKHAWYIHELADRDHGYFYYLGKKLTWSIVNFISNKIIVNSRFTLDYFVERKLPPNKKSKVIYYGVPIERLKENDRDFEAELLSKWNNTKVWKILIAGRTAEGKGQEDIINALRILKDEYQLYNFHLTILGAVPGKYYDKLERLINEQNLRGNIEMLPFTESPGRYYKEAHIGVTTSRNEAFGRITVEYQKSNMVVVGANAGATHEIIQNNINGYLYDLENNKQFAEILKTIMTNPDQSKSMAMNSKLAAEKKFNLTKHGNEIINFLFDEG